MRYLIALICPPAALVICRRWGQAVVVLGLYGLGLGTARWGIGALPLLIAMIWAVHVVGDTDAAADTRRFIRTVGPIRLPRS